MGKLTKVNNLIERKTSFRFIKVRPREFIPVIKEKFGNKKLVGAEIGVLAGVTSKQLMEELNIKKLYLIDSYKGYWAYNQYDLDLDYNKAKVKMEKWKNKVKFIIKDSEEAVKDIKEELDFVYIDGDHSYEWVKKDIKNYWKILKKGGIMAGDDFWNAKECGVIKAVTEFGVENDLDLYVKNIRWWFIK